MNTDQRATGSGSGSGPGSLGSGSGSGSDARDLLGAYALDAVDDIERRAVDRLVSTDPESARELEGLVATAAMLGSAVAAAPPADLRAAVLAEISRTPQLKAPGSPSATVPAGVRTGRGQTTGGAERRVGVPRRSVWLAVAATALGAAAVPSAVAWQQAQQTQRVEQQAQAFSDLLTEPGAQVVRADVAGGGVAVGVLAQDRALFTASGLGAPADDRVYQLWVLRDGEASPAGILSADAGRVQALADDFVAGDGLAVTVEPAGGSEQPTTDPIVVLQPA